MTQRDDGGGPDVLPLALLVLVSHLALLHRSAAGEPDVIVMAAGMIRHLTGSASLSESILYGRQNGPGTYLLILPLLEHVLPRPGALLGVLNVLGAVASAALVWPVHRLFRMTLSRHGGAAAVLLAFLSPVMWEAGTSYHPIWPALLLWTLAAVLLADPRRVTPARTALACVLAALGFLLRTELVLTLPGLLWCAAAMRPRRAYWGAIVACLLVTAVTYLVVEAAVTREGAVAHSLSQYASHFVESFLRVSAVGRNLVYGTFAVGIVTLIALAVAILRGRRAPAPHAWGALLLIVPALALWLPNAVPLQRHFLTIAPVAAWAVCRLWLDRLPSARALACALLVVAGNIALPEVAYRTFARDKAPHGTLLSQHQRVEARAERFADLAPHAAEPRTCAQVGWDAYGYVLYDLASRGMRTGEPVVRVLESGMVERRYPTAHGDTLRLLVADRPSWLANPLAYGAALSQCAAGAAHVWVPREAMEDQAVPASIPHVATY